MGNHCIDPCVVVCMGAPLLFIIVLSLWWCLIMTPLPYFFSFWFGLVGVIHHYIAALKIIIGWLEQVNHFFLGPGHSHEEQDRIKLVLKNRFY